MLSLTDELLEQCITQLAPADILNCSSTCKRINQIITKSIPTQYKLHKHLYQDDGIIALPHDSESKSKVTTIDKLSNIIKRQKALSKLSPSLTSFTLDPYEEVICAYGDYIATAFGYRGGCSSDIDKDGKYPLFTLKRFGHSASGKKVVTEKKQYRLPFNIDMGTLVIDISRNIVIVQELLRDPLRVRLHIFKVFNQDEVLEYQGAEVMEWKFEELDNYSWHGSRITLEPQDCLNVSIGFRTMIYNWKNGYHKFTIILPSKVFYNYHLYWIGTDIIVIKIRQPFNLGRGESGSFAAMGYLFIYHVKDLTSKSSFQPTSPSMILQIPCYLPELPAHMKSELLKDGPINFNISPGRLLQTGSSEQGILHLTIYGDVYPITSPEIFHRCTKSIGLSIIFTPKKIRDLVQAVSAGRVASMDSPGRWIQSCFNNSQDIPIIHPHEWHEHAIWTFETMLPTSGDSYVYGIKLVSYGVESIQDDGDEDDSDEDDSDQDDNDQDDSDQDDSDQDDSDEDEIEHSSQIQIVLLDLNPRILKSATSIGHALGGQGQAILTDQDGNITQKSKSTPQNVISVSAPRQICFNKEYPEATRYEIQYTHKGAPVASIHYDGDTIILEHEVSGKYIASATADTSTSQ